MGARVAVPVLAQAQARVPVQEPAQVRAQEPAPVQVQEPVQEPVPVQEPAPVRVQVPVREPVRVQERVQEPARARVQVQARVPVPALALARRRETSRHCRHKLQDWPQTVPLPLSQFAHAENFDRSFRAPSLIGPPPVRAEQLTTETL